MVSVLLEFFNSRVRLRRVKKATRIRFRHEDSKRKTPFETAISSDHASLKRTYKINSNPVTLGLSIF